MGEAEPLTRQIGEVALAPAIAGVRSEALSDPKPIRHRLPAAPIGKMSLLYSMMAYISTKVWLHLGFVA